MTHAKIQGKFYPLQHNEWLSISRQLTHSELKVLYHLRTLDPFGEKFQEASTKVIAQDLGISQRTVQRAVVKLAELELIDLEITHFNFKVKTQATPMSPSDTHVTTATPMSPPRHPCRHHDTHVATTTPMSPPQPKKPTTTESCHSKIYKTYTDFIKTLSEEERANFLDFCRELSKNLSQPVNDIEAWLAHKNRAGQNRWEVYYSNFKAQQKQKSSAPLKRRRLHDEIEKRRLAAIQARQSQRAGGQG